MSANRQPGGGESPAKQGKNAKSGRASTAKARRKPGRKGGSKGKPSGPRKLPPIPLLALWIVAVVFLAALIYFSRKSGQHSAEVRIPPTTAAHIADSAPAQVHNPPGNESPQPDRPHSKPETAGSPASGHMETPATDSERKLLPTGPALPPNPVFSSRDLPPDSSSHRQGLLSVARNSPSSIQTLPASPPTPAKPSLARIAIVIDDFGQDIEIAKKFVLLPFPVSFSILPYQQHSREIAELIHSYGKEVLLHCPMEPLGYPKVDPGRGALLLSMSEDTIKQNIRNILDNSPYVTGVNNHMGSRMTENAAAMKTVLEEIGRRGLFFIDSYTSPNSKAYQVARELKVPSRRRDIFLDNNAAVDSVRSQVSRLIRKARIEGTALAIGHPREATLKVLQESAEQFREQGIEVVHARDLMGGP